MEACNFFAASKHALGGVSLEPQIVATMHAYLLAGRKIPFSSSLASRLLSNPKSDLFRHQVSSIRHPRSSLQLSLQSDLRCRSENLCQSKRVHVRDR